MKTHLASSFSGRSVRLQPSFAPRADATFAPAINILPSANAGLDQLSALRERVAASLEQEFAETIGSRFVRQIVNEATALAATTSFPTLLLPALAEEKARKASAWAARQRTILHPALTLAA